MRKIIAVGLFILGGISMLIALISALLFFAKPKPELNRGDMIDKISFSFGYFIPAILFVLFSLFLFRKGKQLRRFQ